MKYRTSLRTLVLVAATLGAPALVAAQVLETIATLPQPSTFRGRDIGLRPNSLAVAPNRDVLVASNYQVWRFTADGRGHVIAGTGIAGFSGDGGPALNAQFFDIGGMAFDSAGNLYLADTAGQRIRRIDMTSGIITTIAGTGIRGFGGDGGPPLAATFADPWGLVFDSSGRLFVADAGNCRIRSIFENVVTTVSTESTCDPNSGGAKAVALSGSTLVTDRVAVVVDTDGNVYRSVPRVVTGPPIKVTRTTPDGTTTDFLTNVQAFHLAIDRADNSLYLALTFSVQRAIGGVLLTIAGTGFWASFVGPQDVAVASDGTVYVADTSNDSVKRINTAGSISVVGAYTEPRGVAVDGAGDLYVASLAGVVRVPAGSGVPVAVGPTLPAHDVEVDANGNVFAAYRGDLGPAGSVRRFTPAGVETIIIDGFRPYWLAMRPGGVIAVTETAAHNLNVESNFCCADEHFTGPFQRRGDLELIPGATTTLRHYRTTSDVIFRGETYNTYTLLTDHRLTTAPGGNGLAIDVRVVYPSGLALDSAGDLYFAEGPSGRIRRMRDPDNPDSLLIGPIADRTIPSGVSTVIPYAITTGNPSPIYTITATSSNTALIPNGSSHLLASQSPPFTITITPEPNRSGSSAITLTVSDGRLTTQRSFVVTVPQVVPGPPTAPVATFSGGNIVLNWTASATSGDPPTGWILEAGTAPGFSNLGSFPINSSTPSLTVPAGLPPGTYYVRVRGTNAAGTGAPSPDGTLTVGAPACTSLPPTPGGLVQAVFGNLVTVAWNPTAAAERHIIEAGSVHGASNLAVVPLAPAMLFISATVPNGIYFVRVRAANACGVSAPSADIQVVVGFSRPGAPTGLVASAVGSTVSIAWNAPSVGGAVIDYVLEAGTGPGLTNVASFAVSGMQVSVNGVPSGVYYIRVRARNGAGTGPPSSEVTLVVQ